MRAEIEFMNVGTVEAAMTVVMPIRDWYALRKCLTQTNTCPTAAIWPASDFLRSIDDLIGKVETHFHFQPTEPAQARMDCAPDERDQT